MSPRHHLLWSALCLCGLALPSAAVAAETHATCATSPAEAAWRPLFKADLSDARTSPGVWTLTDGVWTASKDEALWTQASYGDFELELEFKNEPGTNSGVILRASDVANWIPNSIEVQVADDFAEKWAKQPPTWHCGGLFGHVPPAKRAVKPAGEWNHLRILCKGPQVRVVLNGEVTVDTDLRTHTSAKVNPDGSPIPPWLSTPFAELKPRGALGLQGKHADASVFYRNLKIRSLD